MRRPDENYDPGDGLGLDPHRDRPRKASRREVALRLNGLAVALNAAHEQLAELRHELQIEERIEPLRRAKVETR